jgi:hypothetical protein
VYVSVVASSKYCRFSTRHDFTPPLPRNIVVCSIMRVLVSFFRRTHRRPQSRRRLTVPVLAAAKTLLPVHWLGGPTSQYKNSAPLVLLSRSLIKKYKRTQPRLSEHLCLLVASHYGGVGSESDTPVGSCFLVGSSSVMAMSLRCRFIGRTYLCLVRALM